MAIEPREAARILLPGFVSRTPQSGRWWVFCESDSFLLESGRLWLPILTCLVIDYRGNCSVSSQYTRVESKKADSIQLNSLRRNEEVWSLCLGSRIFKQDGPYLRFVVLLTYMPLRSHSDQSHRDQYDSKGFMWSVR